MNIGVVCYPTFGGSGVVATELGLALAHRGHQVHFITYQQPARLMAFETNIYFHEVSSYDYPLFEHSPYDLALASKMVDVVKFEKLDLLHVHYAIPHATVAYLAKKILQDEGISIPVITTLHGTDITLVGQQQSFAPVVEFSINHSDGVTAVSEFLKEETYSTFNIRKDIEVIPNFIDFNRFNKKNKDHFKKAIAPEGQRILTHISNFRKVKRVQDVIHVFERVRQKIPATLLLIGDGPERNAMEALCRQLGLCDEIRFLGKQEAVEEILAISDLFLLPSESESFGLAALEAMACEVPVISSNAGGLPEVNLHGHSGFLADVGDIDAMTTYALQILTDDKTLEKFRKGAYMQAKKFDVAEMVTVYEKYYASMLVHN
jgi:N-acetyl-alpha-D-glucosaminyl L-malate synthase BshA